MLNGNGALILKYQVNGYEITRKTTTSAYEPPTAAAMRGAWQASTLTFELALSQFAGTTTNATLFVVSVLTPNCALKL